MYSLSLAGLPITYKIKQMVVEVHTHILQFIYKVFCDLGHGYLSFKRTSCLNKSSAFTFKGKMIQQSNAFCTLVIFHIAMQGRQKDVFRKIWLYFWGPYKATHAKINPETSCHVHVMLKHQTWQLSQDGAQHRLVETIPVPRGENLLNKLFTHHTANRISQIQAETHAFIATKALCIFWQGSGAKQKKWIVGTFICAKYKWKKRTI